jgi:hypothetical protein
VSNSDPWNGGIYTYRRPDDVNPSDERAILDHKVDPEVDVVEIGLTVIRLAAAVLKVRAVRIDGAQPPTKFRSELISMNDPLCTSVAWRGADGRHYACFDLADGRGAGLYRLPSDVTPLELTALEAMQKAVHFLGLWKDKDHPNAILYGFAIGSLQERLHAQQHEADALKGKRQTERAREAGRSRNRLTPDQERAAVKEVRAKMSAGRTLEDACTELKDKYQVSLSTLKRKVRGQPFD